MASTKGVSISFKPDLLIRLKDRAHLKNVPLSVLVCDLLEAAIDEQPKQIERAAADVSNEQIAKSLRDSLRKCKIASPVKTELVSILNAILKDETSSITLQQTVVDLGMDDDPELDSWLAEREAKKTAKSLSALQSTDVFRPGGAMQRAIERGNKDSDGLRKFVVGETETNRETSRATEPNPNYHHDEDWHPEDDE